MARHNNLGKWGEEQAVEYLVARGFSIVGKDTILGKNEVDIIAMKDGRIHFVEVKTRSNPLDDPIRALSKAKIQRLFRFADSYIRAYGIKHEPQFDVIAIVGTIEGGILTLDYYPDEQLPPLQ